MNAFLSSGRSKVLVIASSRSTLAGSRVGGRRRTTASWKRSLASTSPTPRDSEDIIVVSSSKSKKTARSTLLQDGLTFNDFVSGRMHSPGPAAQQQQHPLSHPHNNYNVIKSSAAVDVPMLSILVGRTYHLKTYGCQMNVNDSDLVRSVLKQAGMEEVISDLVDDNKANMDVVATPDVILTNTCAIRDGAEQKVWTRLQQLRAMTRRQKQQQQPKRQNQSNTRCGTTSSTTLIGVLGCMAERLQSQLLQDDVADLVVGPDAYRSLPQLIATLLASASAATSSSDEATLGATPPTAESTSIPVTTGLKKHQRPRALAVELSTTETYADILPHRSNSNNNGEGATSTTSTSSSAFVSIQRGCSNRCSFCIVPFTRGTERSRPYQSILDEVRWLVNEGGVREVTLLGQNVNSYHDQSSTTTTHSPTTATNTYTLSNDGFRSRLRRPSGGYFFADLLAAVAEIDPHHLRVRFTTPHPKDYPQHLHQLMAGTPNICNHLHMPAQSGSTTVLQRMKRGYSREAYLQLIADVRQTIPDVALSSDFIAGFCDETESEHAETISLLHHVQYDQAYMFAYSRRDGTHAARTMSDTVPVEIKQRRLQQIIETYQHVVHAKNTKHEVGRIRLVLVEGPSKRSKSDAPMWHGRTDQNKRIVFPVHPHYEEFNNNDETTEPSAKCWSETQIRPYVNDIIQQPAAPTPPPPLVPIPTGRIQKGDYGVVQVTEAKGHTLRGRLLWRSDSILSFEQMGISSLSKMRCDVESQFVFAT